LDILSKRKSLPVVYAMEVAPPKVKRELGTLYMQRVLDATSAPRVVELLDGVGARQFCEERVERALEEAVSALSDTPMPDHARGGLAGMAGFAARAGLTA
jgi:geranylgeranyl pyrophosphate synthase